MDHKENKDKNAEVPPNKEDKPSSKRPKTLPGQLLKRAGTIIERKRSETKAKMQAQALKNETHPEEAKTASPLPRKGTLAQVTGRLRALTKGADQLEKPGAKNQRSETNADRKAKEPEVNLDLWNRLHSAINETSPGVFEAEVELIKDELREALPRMGKHKREKEFNKQLKALVNHSTLQGETIMNSAAIRDVDRSVLESLVQLGGDLDQAPPKGNTPLITAIMVGNTENVKTLLRLGANVNTVADNSFADRVSPLIAAVSASSPDIEIIDALLEKNPDLSITDQNGRTALDHAKDSREKEIVQKLTALELKAEKTKKKTPSISDIELKEIVDLQKNLEENFTRCKKEKQSELSEEDKKIIDNLIQGVYYIENRLAARMEIDAKTPPVAEIKRRLIVANQVLLDILKNQLSSQKDVQAAETTKVEVVPPEEISTDKGPAVQPVKSEPKPKTVADSRKSIVEFSYEDDDDTESIVTEDVDQPKSAAKTPPVSYKSNVYQTSPSGMTQYQEALTKIMSLTSKIGAVKVQEQRVNLRDTLKIIGKSFDYQKWIAENKPVQSTPSDRERVFMAIDKLDNLLKKVEKAHKRVEEFKEESPGKKVPRILTTWEKYTKAEVRSQLEKMAKNPIKSSLEGLLEDEKKATMRASNVSKKSG